MKIAILVPSLRDKSPIHVAMNIANHLAYDGNEVTVFYFGNQIEIKLNSKIRYVPISFSYKIDWNNFEIVHSHLFVPDAYVFLKKPRACKTRFVTTIHNYVYSELKNYYSTLVALVLGSFWFLFWTRFDRLFVLSDDAVLYYSKFIGGNRVRRIYNGVDISINPSEIKQEHFEMSQELRRNYGYIIGVYSALIHRKKVDVIIRHLSRVKKGGLLILGEGPLRVELEKLAISLEVSDRIRFLGHVPSAHQYNGIFDLFIMPSINEGFGLSLIEAALHGKKIVCSDWPVFKELFHDNEVTFYEYKNDSTIDAAISLALVDEEKPLLATTKALKNYSVKTMVVNYTNMYIEALNS